MKRIVFVLIVIVALCSVSAFCDSWKNSLKPKGKSQSFVAVVDKKPKCYILIPDNSVETEIDASNDLVKYFKEISGADFKIIKESEYKEGKFISVGNTNLLSKAGFGDIISKLKEEGYAIEEKNGNMYLFGGKLRGPLYAVYALLEEDLGCRWYTRLGDDVIPKMDNFKFTYVSRYYNPPFITRAPTNPEMVDARYVKYNRINTYSAYGFVHTSFFYVSPENFKDHPEWFSMENGKRVPHQLCWSNPEVVEVVKTSLRGLLKDNPNIKSFNISPQDGYPLCDCPRCNELDKKEGSKSATLINALNQVCEDIEKDYPDVKIVTLAYLDYVTPPKTIKPHKNLTIMICSDSCDWPYPLCSFDETDKFQNDLSSWISTGADTLTWNYTYNCDHFLIPNPNMEVVAKDIRFLKAKKVGGVFLQGCCYEYAITGSGYLKTWVWAKQLWNPNLDTKELMKDFIYGYYGSAAEPIWQYESMLLGLWEKNHKQPHNVRTDPKTKSSECNVIFDRGNRWTLLENIYTDEFVNKAMTLMDKSLSLAKDEKTKNKVRYVRLSPIYLYLGREVGFYKGSDEFVKGKLDKKKYEYYNSLIDETDSTLSSLQVKTIAETMPIVNKEKYIYKWREVLDKDLSLFNIKRLDKKGWLFTKDEDNTGVAQGFYKKDFDTSKWQSIEIEKTWDEQGIAEKYIGNAWYKKTENLKNDMLKYKHVYLSLLAVDEGATIYVNGNLVIEHTCEKLGITPIEIYVKPILIDIKPYIHEGDNDIKVKVYNSIGAGGIYKPIDLIATNSDMSGEELFSNIY